MKLFQVLCAAGLLLATAAPVFASQPTPPTADDKLQAACYPDVDRLCKDAMPDEVKVTACMKQHKADVSAKCQEAYKASGRTD